MIYRIVSIGIFATLCLGAVLPKQESFRRTQDDETSDEPEGPPIPYNFEYNTRDVNGTSLFRKESRDNSGRVQGRYGYKDAFGIERIVEYVADKDGYRAQIKTNEPGTESKNPAAVQLNANPDHQFYYNVPTLNNQPEATTESDPKDAMVLSFDDHRNQPTEAASQSMGSEPTTEVYLQPSQNQQYVFPTSNHYSHPKSSVFDGTAEASFLNQNLNLNLNRQTESPMTSEPVHATANTNGLVDARQQLSGPTVGRQVIQIVPFNGNPSLNQYISAPLAHHYQLVESTDQTQENQIQPHVQLLSPRVIDPRVQQAFFFRHQQFLQNSANPSPLLVARSA